MKKCMTLLLALALLVSINSVPASAQSIKIGVLAKDGVEKCMTMWKPTADYLTETLPGLQFEIVPLGFEAVFPAVEKGEVSFFLVNSSMFVTAKQKYGAREIATMVNTRQGQDLNSFGGLIFCSALNESIKKLEDLKGKKFMAVDATSFGGWQMGWKVLLDNGIDPAKDLSKLEFGGKHENVVYAVENGTVDAGTVRTDTLERMAADGKIALEDFRILNKTEHKGFPFLCSTPLYPEWPMAALKAAPEDLSAKVSDALQKLPRLHAAAQAAKVTGWSAPMDYSEVLTLQKTLGLQE